MPIDPKKGYFVPDYNTFLNAMKEIFIKWFGANINLSDDAILGMFSNILAQNNQNNDKNGLAIYKAMFAKSSVGSQLDDIGTEETIFRKPANSAYVDLNIQCYVDANSPTIITTDDGEFSTADGHIFKILPKDGSESITFFQQSTDENNQPLVDEDGNPLGQITVQAISVDTGADNNVMAHTIVNAEQSIDGFYKVDNPSAATGGRDTESDDSFFNRIEDNRIFKPNSTHNGIEAAIKNLNSVVDARLVNNNSMETDQYGNPPKSIHLYVVGGNDQEIADTMLDTMPPFAHTIGNKSAIAIDVGNKQQTINFDQAKTVEIYMQIDITTDASKFNSDTGISTIKSNIVNYFSDFKMGDTVDFTKLFGPCYSPVGVNAVQISLGTSPDSVQLNSNVSVNDFELPVAHPDSIQINNQKAGV